MTAGCAKGRVDRLFRRIVIAILVGNCFAPTGPDGFSFFVQPAVASFFAFGDAILDARKQKPAYFWTLFVRSEHRRELLRQAWRSAGGVFMIAIVIDLVYQTVVLRGFRPVQAVFVLLALWLYLILRGPVNRIANLMKTRESR